MARRIELNAHWIGINPTTRPFDEATPAIPCIAPFGAAAA